MNPSISTLFCARFVVLACGLVLPFCPVAADPAAKDPAPAAGAALGARHDEQVLFRSGEAQTKIFRIPALITAANGDLVAVCDARRENGEDLGRSQAIDIVCRRSEDNGKTWGPLRTLCALGRGHPASDPSLLLDAKTGELFCFYNTMDQAKAPGECHLCLRSSKDHGLTWGEQRDLTAGLSDPAWRKDAQFITSGRGVQMRDGTLVHTLVHLRLGVFLVVSRDHGASWQRLPAPLKPADESKVVELADGRWMVNARINGAGRRRVYLSDDGGRSWQARDEASLVDPGCNASILRLTDPRAEGDRGRLLFCSVSHARQRRNLSVRMSLDDGAHWLAPKVIAAGSAAYSELTRCKDGSVGVLYEAEDYREIRFLRFEAKELEEGK